MEKTEVYKKRANSTTGYVNETFEDSERELSKVSSTQVHNDDHSISYKGTEKMQNVQEFSKVPDMSSNSAEFIPKGFRKMYLAALIVLLFAVCMGTTTAYSATATVDMAKNHSSIHPTKEQVSMIGSFMAVGALAGGTAGGYFTNLLGRKGSLMVNTIIFTAGWIIIAFAKSVGMIYAGRIITGFSSGLVSVATPMYLVEISTPEIRGFLGSSFQLFVVVGVLIICSFGAGMPWRWLAGSGGIICVLAAALMITMPESPRWLMSKNRRADAKKAITFLQGEAFDAEAECQVLEDEIKRQPVGRIQLSEFYVPTVYKPLILSILLMFFQQFCGVNAVMFYTAEIFKAARVPLDSIVCTIIVAVVQVLATLLASVLMDRAGRKILLLISAACMAVSLFIFGGYNYAKDHNTGDMSKYGWLPVVCLTTFIAAFSIGYGPAPWLMVAEMTPGRVRSIVSGVATALNWTFVFIITYTFDKLISGIHASGAYWLYGGIITSSMLITHFFLPETKGKKAEEIEEFFRRK